MFFRARETRGYYSQTNSFWSSLFILIRIYYDNLFLRSRKYRRILRKRESFNLERGDVAFYCKDCEKVVDVNRPNPKGYTFICSVCGGKNIAI